MIGIIDYGCGNVSSIQNMFSRIGIWSETVADPLNIDHFDSIVLPGVGAFDTGVNKLKETGFWKAIKIFVEHEKKPILGICLGMQLFFEKSQEGKEYGFSWLPGELKKFVPGDSIRVPHIGWEPLMNTSKSLFCNNDNEFYFVHAYHAPTDLEEKFVIATGNYGVKFPAAVKKDNVIGFQFHPEKSLNSGKELLRRWHQNVTKK